MAKQVALLGPLAGRTDGATARSKKSASHETGRTRGAYFLKFLQKHHFTVQEGIGDSPGHVAIVQLYVMSLTEGYNINAMEMHSATLRKYMQAVNDMFESRGFKIPIEWTDKENSSVKFLNAVSQWAREPT